MTATLTATAQSTNVPPRVLLTLTGMTPDTSVVITRIDQFGNRAVVRTANPKPLTSGGMIGYDYEAQFNQPCTYVAAGSSGSSATSLPVTLLSSQSWLTHPGVPSFSMPVTIFAHGDETTSLNQGVFTILGRKTPVTVTDGARHAPTFDLTLRTGLLAGFLPEEAAMVAILGDGAPLLLQGIYPDNPARNSYDWLSFADVVKSNPTTWVGFTIRDWTSTVTVVDPPAGLLQSQWSVASVAAAYPTVAAVKAAYSSVRNVVLNAPG